MGISLRERIAGCLIGAAYGDALGAPTENRTREQIYEKWGYVDQLLDPPSDVFARGNKAGQVTDDFSMAYVTIQEILKKEGKIDSYVAEKALITWSENERYMEQFAGPTSKKFINQLKNGKSEAEGFEPVNDNKRASNGGAMKIGPIVCFGKGDLEKSLQIAHIICLPTHDNEISMAAAFAVAAAVSSALSGKRLYEIYQTALQGAQAGTGIGRKGNLIAGPSLMKRMETAAFIGMTEKNVSSAMDKLRNYFDCSGMAADSVPVSFGLMIAARGDVMEAVEAAANIGNDTDTMATIAGAILGAYRGRKAFSEKLVNFLDSANGYHLNELAEKIEKTKILIEVKNDL